MPLSLDNSSNTMISSSSNSLLLRFEDNKLALDRREFKLGRLWSNDALVPLLLTDSLAAVPAACVESTIADPSPSTKRTRLAGNVADGRIDPVSALARRISREGLWSWNERRGGGRSKEGLCGIFVFGFVRCFDWAVV